MKDMNDRPQVIEITIDGHSVTIWPNRSGRRNTMIRRITSELTDALLALRRHRAVVADAETLTKGMLLNPADDQDTRIGSAAQALAATILSDEGRKGITSCFDKRPPSWAQVREAKG